MGKPVSWQPRILRQIRETILYFQEELDSEQAVENFLDRLDQKADWVSRHAEAGHPTSKPDVRHVKVDKNRSVFYRIKSGRVLLIFLWDWRRNPEQNPYWPSNL